jgi:signal transduction histidine kinase
MAALRGHGWLLAGAVALVAGAWWLRASDVRYLVAAVVATVVAALLALGLPARARRWAFAGATAMLVFCAIAAMAQRTLARIEGDWPAYRAELVQQGADALDAELMRTVHSLRATAARALDAPAQPRDAFAALARLVPADQSMGVVLYRDSVPAAWAGRIVVPTDSVQTELSARFTPFYITLNAVARREGDRAVASAVVYAEPPAARLVAGVANGIAKRVGLRSFRFVGPRERDSSGVTFAFAPAGDTLFRAQAIPLGAAETALLVRTHARYQGVVVLGMAVLLFLIATWRRTPGPVWRLAPLGVVLLMLAVTPLNAFSDATVLFDPTVYFASLGGAFTASAGALMLAGAVVMLALLLLLRENVRAPSRWIALAVALAIIGGGPFLLRALSRGITPPPGGVSTNLWLAWEVALFLAAASLLIVAAAAGSMAVGTTRGLPPALAPALAALAAMSAPLVLRTPAQWPAWYHALWIAAIGALALTRPHRRIVFTAAAVAALGATTLTWNAGVRGRIALANRDVEGLSSFPPDVAQVLTLFADRLARGGPPNTEGELLRRYVRSDLEGTGYPVRLSDWTVAGRARPAADLVLAPFDPPAQAVARLVSEVRATGARAQRTVIGVPGTFLVLAVPYPGGDVATVVVAPRTQLIPENPFNALLGLPPRETGEAPYRLSLTDVAAISPASGLRAGTTTWRRTMAGLHGDRVVRTSLGLARAHLEVSLRSPDILVQRGALVVLLDLVLVAALWFLSALPSGAFSRWWRGGVRRWAASYRARLTLVLFAFFVIPEVAFAVWAYQRLQSEDRESRELLLRGTLEVAAGEDLTNGLRSPAVRLATPLLLYDGGMLASATEPLYAELSPVGQFLPAETYLALRQSREVYTSHLERVGDVHMLLGFRAAVGPAGRDVVVAAPARGHEETVDQRRHDLGVLVLFASVLGALAALWLSGVAARSLALPIGRLRSAALAIAAGEREPPLAGGTPEEFAPVFSAFRHMAADLGESHAALESAQRRTAAVLRNVASGVVAVSADGSVTLANPRAEALLGRPLPAGLAVADIGALDLATRVPAFLQRGADEEEFDVLLDGRQLQARLTRLASGTGGAVLTLDDVTELARAQRVLAWGEMARQVAHEIKNPLTPIRLGVQHLKRAHADARHDFDAILDRNVERILAEIDRLDEIARSFSRYGVAPADRPATERIDVAAAVRDVVKLERLGAGTIVWGLHGVEPPAHALARDDELREVLLNVLENARLADARHVDVTLRRAAECVIVEVADDGSGIPADLLPRIFEPHFSTRTRGSGLGLPISRQLVEGWGGTMAITSEEGAGTTVRMELRASEAD